MTGTHKKNPDDVPYNKRMLHGGRVITTTRRKERRGDILIGVIVAIVEAAIGAICLWLLVTNASDIMSKGVSGYVVVLIGGAFSVGMFGYAFESVSEVMQLLEEERNSR